MLTLYPDQQEYFTALRGLFQPHRSVLAQAATGFGKTVIGCKVAQGAALRRTPTAFVVHRQELVDQTCEAFTKCGIAHGVIAPGHPETRHDIQVASVFTLARRKPRNFRLIIWDECHHAAAAQWRTVSGHYPEAKHLGLTATPCRLDGQGLADLYETMLCAKPMRELIQMGRLSPYRYFNLPVVDLSGLRKRGEGDYSHEALERAMASRAITGDVITEYKKHCDGAPFIAFCHSVPAAQALAESFRAAGYPVQSVDGKMERTLRRDTVRALGRTLVGITSCDLISEGFDCPGAVAGLLVRPTASLSLHLQQVGRILRHVPGKTAMLLDFVGNYLRHYLPDTPREWSLSTGVVKPVREAIECPDIRACEKCYAVHEWAPVCPYCGHVYPVQAKAAPKQEKGELREMTPEEIQALEALARRTGRLADYHAAEKAKAKADKRDYKPGSAWYKWKNRSRRAVGG